MIERELGRIVRVRGWEERRNGIVGGNRGNGGKEAYPSFRKTYWRGGEIRRKGVDEDLTVEERRVRWRIVETARRERAKGKRVVAKNRELWVERIRWKWDEEG